MKGRKSNASHTESCKATCHRICILNNAELKHCFKLFFSPVTEESGMQCLIITRSLQRKMGKPQSHLETGVMHTSVTSDSFFNGVSTRIALTASGTMGSLCRVLFTIRSCYLCTIGFTQVFSLRGVTSPLFKLHSERALLDCTNGTLKDIPAMQVTGLSPSLAGLFQAGLKHCRICHKRHCITRTAPHSVSSQSGT